MLESSKYPKLPLWVYAAELAVLLSGATFSYYADYKNYERKNDIELMIHKQWNNSINSNFLIDNNAANLSRNYDSTFENSILNAGKKEHLIYNKNNKMNEY